MQNITIKSVQEKHSKDGSKTFYIVTDNKGAEMSSFEAEVMAFQPGTVIDADIEVNGKYTNLKGFKVISNPAPSAEKPTTQPQPYQRVGFIDNSASIEAQVAVKEIGEDWRAGKLKDDDSLVAVYKGWIAAKLGNCLPKPVTTQINPEVPQQVNAAPESTGTTEEVEFINMDWLRESLGKLRWITVVKWMKEHYPEAKGTKVSEVVKSLTVEHRIAFGQEVQSRLEMG
jgi:hypothetical protein